jgi:hypothetical protein
MTSSCCSCHHAAALDPAGPGPSNEAYLSSPHLEASPATTFRACSSPAPTRVKTQPTPAILSQESVHTTLSITHHTRKRPSTGPRTTPGPQLCVGSLVQWHSSGYIGLTNLGSELEKCVGSRFHLVGVSISFEKNFYRLPFTPPSLVRRIGPSSGIRAGSGLY